MGLLGNFFVIKNSLIANPILGNKEYEKPLQPIANTLFRSKVSQTNIEISTFANQNSITENQKRLLSETQINKEQLKSEAEGVLKEVYENAQKEFISLDAHFRPMSMSVHPSGISMSFVEKDMPNSPEYTIYFEDNIAQGHWVN